jgi:hypothetical protein
LTKKEEGGSSKALTMKILQDSSEVSNIFTADTRQLTPVIVQYKNLEKRKSPGSADINNIFKEVHADAV